ncbi:PAN domain family protein [Acanthocheilonema viteae]
MTITVSFIESSINIFLFLIISTCAVGDYKASIDALKPCFERYIGQRLSELPPYHSEWRMKTPEECLLFCALSSSRCRSIVHDIFQHICYYFLNDGQQYAQIARGMVYFRVINKKCLDQFLNGSSLTLPDSEFAIPEISPSTPKYNTITNSIELQRAIAHANPLIHVPPGGRAITPTPYFDYFDNQQKFKKHEKFDELNITIANSPMTTSDNFQKSQYYTVISTSGITTTTLPSSSTVFPKVFSEYDEVISSSELSSPIVPILEKDSINSTSRKPKEALQQSNHQIYPSDDASFFIGNIGNIPVSGTNFGKGHQKDGIDLNKLLKAIPEYVRRSPIKSSLINAEKLNKIKDANNLITLFDTKKSIIDRLVAIPTIKSISITPSKQTDRMERLLSSGVCGSNKREVWLNIENAILQTDRLQKKTTAGSYKSCRAKCNLITNSGRECNSFTYDEVKRYCIAYINNDNAVMSSLAFLPSPESDFKIRTAVKFCYPGNLIIFEGCSEFTAFLGYTMNVKPRKIFDDVPRGHHGLHACIELCVVAPHFHCKSGAFILTSGKCLLYDEDSLSTSEYFHKHQQSGLIYFENGCEQFDDRQIPTES